MSLKATFERSKSSRTAFQTGPGSLFAFLCPAISSPTPVTPVLTRQLHQSGWARRSQPPSGQAMDNFFITALVRASTCQKHAKHYSPSSRSIPSATTHHKVRRKAGVKLESKMYYSSQVEQNEPPDGEPPEITDMVSREELIGLVDIYGECDTSSSDVSDEPLVGPAALHRGLNEEFFSESESATQFDERDAVRKTVQNILRLLKDQKGTPDAVFKLYQTLPPPRASYFTIKEIHSIMDLVFNVEHKREAVMLRVLSILEDMKAAKMSIPLSLWNMGIYVAGIYASHITMAEVESSLSIWKQMEDEVGTKGDIVTFNILFEIAVIAGKYLLAETIFKEVNRRGLKFDRISRMAQIHYQGLRRDGSGVRRAYAELVEAGEIVTTAVLNNVIQGLLSSGELPAAEETFERMKAMHAQKQGATVPPEKWREKHQLRKIVNKAAKSYRQDDEKRRNFQDAAPICPDGHTYTTFIRYHSSKSGNLDRVFDLLEELEMNGIPMTGSMFYWIFFGFQKHGGILYSSWRKARLELFWSAFLKACDDTVEEVYCEHGCAVAAVWAFHKCAGKERAEEVWAELRGRYEPEPKTLGLVNYIFTRGPGQQGDLGRI